MIDMKRYSRIHALLLFVIFNSAVWANEIHQAARAGNLQKVTAILAQDMSQLNQLDNKGNAPIHSAVSKGRSNIINYLVQKGARLDIKNKNGLTPLYQALDLSRNNVAKLLIEHGADTAVRGYRRRTLLHACARSGNTVIARLLLNKGADVNVKDSRQTTPLDLAVESGKAEVGRILLSNGGQLNSFDVKTNAMEQILNRAVTSGQNEVIDLLNEAGVNLNIQTQSGHGYIHKAAAGGRLDMIKSMVTHGLDINVVCENGKTPLDYAMLYGHRDVSQYLQQNGGRAQGAIPEMPTLSSVIPSGTAHIWYLGHSAWAIRTKQHLLIFDYTNRGEKPVHANLINGYIQPEELKNLNVCVFVSHSHGDHYDSKIFNWSSQISNIQYILGFNPRRVSSEKYVYLAPRSDKLINDMHIQTIRSTDAGVGFVVTVDGITLYHAGDHANKSKTQNNAYHQEIDYIASMNKQIDVAFLLAGGGCGGGYSDEVLQGTYYTLRKLSPNAVFPMHSGANEHVYQNVKTEAAGIGLDQCIVAASFKGDHFIYCDKRAYLANALK